MEHVPITNGMKLVIFIGIVVSVSLYLGLLKGAGMTFKRKRALMYFYYGARFASLVCRYSSCKLRNKMQRKF